MRFTFCQFWTFYLLRDLYLDLDTYFYLFTDCLFITYARRKQSFYFLPPYQLILHLIYIINIYLIRYDAAEYAKCIQSSIKNTR